MIKCPKCGLTLSRQQLFAGDRDSQIWNFDGYSAIIETKTYCPHCEEIFTLEMKTKINIYKGVKIK